MKELFADANEYWKIRQKQRRSVDPAIREGTEGAIMERSAVSKPSVSTDGNPPEESESRTPFDYAGIFEESRKANVAIFGKTGEGKSIWLTEFAKWAVLAGKKAKFIEAKAIRPEHLQPEGRLRKELENPNAILCVDAIDEVRNPEVRMKILTLLNEIRKRCVITSRPSEIDGFSASVIPMELEKMNAEEFVSSRMPDARTRRRILESLRKMGILERLHANPLMLSFACMLEGELEGEVKTKTQFMERIARFVLSKHAKESKEQDFTEEDLDEWMKKLATYAYEKLCGTERSNRNPSFDAHLALLFKEGDDGKYDFVHASFYEHFLSRYVANSENPSTIVMDWKRSIFPDSRKPATQAVRNAWKSRLSTIAMTIEMLVHAKKTDELADIANELISDPNDDEVGSGFFL